MGKRVFVTGGTGGLGIPVVTELLEKEWDVTVLIRSADSKKALEKNFPECIDNTLKTIQGDATKEADIIHAFQESGRIDALVHLAGGFKGAESLSAQSEADFQALFSMNTLSSFLLLKNMMPLMKQQGKGSIVMIGAKPALYPSGENALYAASKSALINLVLSAAEEGRKDGIRANVIVPAVIDTAENRKWAGENTRTDHWTSPEEIARTISWLISEASGSTGTILPMFNKISAF